MTCYLSTKKILTAVELAELFFKEVVLKYEMLNDIIIDRNSLFISALIRNLFSLEDEVKIKHCLSFANR
jgi:hypothetical protein